MQHVSFILKKSRAKFRVNPTWYALFLPCFQIFCVQKDFSIRSCHYARYAICIYRGTPLGHERAISADGVEQVRPANAQEEVEHGKKKGRPYDLKTPPIPCHFLKSRPRFSPMPSFLAQLPCFLAQLPCYLAHCLVSSHIALFPRTSSTKLAWWPCFLAHRLDQSQACGPVFNVSASKGNVVSVPVTMRVMQYVYMGGEVCSSSRSSRVSQYPLAIC